LSKQFNMRTFAIVTIEEIMQYLHNREINGRVLINDEMYARMRTYRNEYGGVSGKPA
jgi:orotate phosphoribosyltransferase